MCTSESLKRRLRLGLFFLLGCGLSGCGIPEAIVCYNALNELANSIKDEDCRDGDAQEDLDELARKCRAIINQGTGTQAALERTHEALDNGDAVAAEKHGQEFILGLISEVITDQLPVEERVSEESSDTALSDIESELFDDGTELQLLIGEGGEMCPEELFKACQNAAKIVNRCCQVGVRLKTPGNVEQKCAELCFVTFRGPRCE